LQQFDPQPGDAPLPFALYISRDDRGDLVKLATADSTLELRVLSNEFREGLPIAVGFNQDSHIMRGCLVKCRARLAIQRDEWWVAIKVMF
jgi:hypothetical protein